MKRSTKGILIASGIFLAVGLALVMSGVLMGATWKQVEETLMSGKYTINRWSGTAVEELEFIAESDSITEDNPITEDNLSGITSSEYDAAKIKKIEIEVEAGNLKIKNHDSDKIQFKNENSNGKLSVVVDEDTMHVELKGRGWGNGAKATISIPHDLQLQNMQIDTGAGVVTCESIAAQQLNVEVDSGTFTSTGEIKAEYSSWEVDAGVIKTAAVDSDQIELACEAGNLQMTLVGQQSDFKLDGSCSAGIVEFGKNKYYQDFQNHHGKHAKKNIEANCETGKIKVKFKQ